MLNKDKSFTGWTEIIEIIIYCEITIAKNCIYYLAFHKDPTSLKENMCRLYVLIWFDLEAPQAPQDSVWLAVLKEKPIKMMK